jgi:hypothetical protein
MCLQPRRSRPLDRAPVTYVTVSATAVLLGIGTGPLGLCPPGAPFGALLAWVLLAAAAEIVVGGPRRLNVLPWAVGATMLAAFCGPGAITALLGAAAVVYGLTTVAIVAPVRRAPSVVSRVIPVVRSVASLVRRVSPVVRSVPPVVRSVPSLVRRVSPVVRRVAPVVRRVSPVVRRSAAPAMSGGRPFDITIDLNARPVSEPAVTGSVLALTLT